MTARAASLTLVLLFAGCAAPHQATAPDSKTELILLTPLPPVTSYAMAFGMRLTALFDVRPDGTTKDVSLLQSSGDLQWDSLAVDSLRQWRFTPVPIGGEQTDRWLRYGVVVQVQEPVVMRLAEMVVPNRRKADSLSTLLKEGADFESLAMRTLPGGAEGVWNPPKQVNLARYPGHVRDVLTTLRPQQITEPIRIGLNYVIFKRYRSLK